MSSEKMGDMPVKEIEIATEQQETGYQIWKNRSEYNTLGFWEFYGQWCREQGLFNDRTSCQ